MTRTHHDIVSVLVDDHDSVEQVFGELASDAGDRERRRALADHVIAELVRHSVAEEMYLYPVVRSTLPGGADLADNEMAEHAEAERTMNDLDGVDPTDPRFDELLDTLMTQIRQHVREEETILFPSLREAVTDADLGELGDKVVRAKEVAPTRPHPAAPDRPPLNKLLAPGAGLVDKMRDALSGRDT